MERWLILMDDTVTTPGGRAARALLHGTPVLAGDATVEMRRLVRD